MLSAENIADAKRRFASRTIDSNNRYWVITGESENPDFSGTHYHPILACVQGSFKEAVDYAITLQGFSLGATVVTSGR